MMQHSCLTILILLMFALFFEQAELFCDLSNCLACPAGYAKTTMHSFGYCKCQPCEAICGYSLEEDEDCVCCRRHININIKPVPPLEDKWQAVTSVNSGGVRPVETNVILPVVAIVVTLAFAAFLFVGVIAYKNYFKKRKSANMADVEMELAVQPFRGSRRGASTGNSPHDEESERVVTESQPVDTTEEFQNATSDSDCDDPIAPISTNLLGFKVPSRGNLEQPSTLPRTNLEVNEEVLVHHNRTPTD